MTTDILSARPRPVEPHQPPAPRTLSAAARWARRAPLLPALVFLTALLFARDA